VATETVETLLAGCIGLGLSAACGFRVFAPLLVANLGLRAGMLSDLPAASGLAWLGDDSATWLLAIAAGVEVLAYYIPVVDNLVDAIEVPAAAIAGTLVSASLLGDLPPALQWGLALVAGGGAAETVELATVATRLASTGLTAGLANPLVSTMELLSALVLALLALLLPVLTAIVVVVVLVVCVRQARKWWLAWRRRSRPADGGT